MCSSPFPVSREDANAVDCRIFDSFTTEQIELHLHDCPAYRAWFTGAGAALLDESANKRHKSIDTRVQEGEYEFGDNEVDPLLHFSSRHSASDSPPYLPGELTLDFSLANGADVWRRSLVGSAPPLLCTCAPSLPIPRTQAAPSLLALLPLARARPMASWRR